MCQSSLTKKKPTHEPVPNPKGHLYQKKRTFSSFHTCTLIPLPALPFPPNIQPLHISPSRPSVPLQTNGPRSQSASSLLIGRFYSNPFYINPTETNSTFKETPSPPSPKPHKPLQLSWRAVGNLWAPERRRRRHLGAARPASSSPSAESPVSSRPENTPSASAPAPLSISPPSSNTSRLRF